MVIIPYYFRYLLAVYDFPLLFLLPHLISYKDLTSFLFIFESVGVSVYNEDERCDLLGSMGMGARKKYSGLDVKKRRCEDKFIACHDKYMNVGSRFLLVTIRACSVSTSAGYYQNQRRLSI